MCTIQIWIEIFMLRKNDIIDSTMSNDSDCIMLGVKQHFATLNSVYFQSM